MAADGLARMSSSIDGRVVLQQLPLVEAGLADHEVDDRGAVGAVLDLAGLGLLDGLGDVHRHRADLRVGHLALRAEDAAEPADDRHQVGRRDRDVEVGEAVLHALGEVLGADDVGAGLLGLARLVALREDGDRDVLAEPVRQRDRAAQLLVGVADVQAGADVHLDGLVELGPVVCLTQRDRLGGLVLALAVDLVARLAVAACRAWPSGHHLHAHRAGRARDDLRRLVDVVRVQVRQLALGDLRAAGPG